MSGNWLWDRSGDPEPEVEALERKLAPARYRPRSFELPVAKAPESSAAGPANVLPFDRIGAERAERAELAERAVSTEHAGSTERQRRSRRFVAAVVGVAALAAAFAIVVRGPAPGPAPQAAQRLGARPQLVWRDVEARLTPGEWLETGAGWDAHVAIADIGDVRIAPGTRVRLAEDSSSRQRLELARGEIHATVTAPPALFVVDTPAAKAIDLGCEYTLAVDDSGDGELVVRHGWVQLEGTARYAYVPAGARAPIRRGVGPGVPRYDDAPAALREALVRLERGEGLEDAVAIVLREARRKDSLTLYHLLQRVDGTQRTAVVERLAGLTPPPAGVSRARAAALDVNALEAWGNQLVSTW